MLLEVIKRLVGLDTIAEALSSEDIVKPLAELEERPWPEWKRGKPITVRQMARLLKPFGIRPKQAWLEGSNARAYRQEDFMEIFTRYTPHPPDRTARTARTQQDQQLTEDFDPLGEKNSSGSESPQVLQTKGSSGLADETPPGGGKEHEKTELEFELLDFDPPETPKEAADLEQLCREAEFETRALAMIQRHHPGGLDGWRDRCEKIEERRAIVCEGGRQLGFDELRARIQRIPERGA